jgi:hypothetical protein
MSPWCVAVRTYKKPGHQETHACAALEVCFQVDEHSTDLCLLLPILIIDFFMFSYLFYLKYYFKYIKL